MTALPKHLISQAEDIQYLPHHRCPQCSAEAKTTETGNWLRPYQDWFGTALRSWQDNLGYVYFHCNCQHHPEFRHGLRVVRLGDAILPVYFVGLEAASRMGRHPAQLNAEITQKAVAFLAAHGDPTRTTDSDWLGNTLYAVARGEVSPEVARRELQAWLDGKTLAQDRLPDPELVDRNFTQS